MQTTHLSQLTGEALARRLALKAQVETPHDRIVYGQSRRVEPTFCDVAVGDGAYMLIVTAVRTVPAYHVLLVDSSWVRHVEPGHRCPHGIEADLEDHPERRDMIGEILADACGDGDRWHEEHGDDGEAPKGYYHADMGFYWGIEPLATDGLLRKEPVSELQAAE